MCKLGLVKLAQSSVRGKKDVSQDGADVDGEANFGQDFTCGATGPHGWPAEVFDVVGAVVGAWRSNVALDGRHGRR